MSQRLLSATTSLYSISFSAQKLWAAISCLINLVVNNEDSRLNRFWSFERHRFQFTSTDSFNNPFELRDTNRLHE